MIESSCWIIWANGSMYKASKVELRQQPCLIPLSNVNISERERLTVTLAEGLL